MTRPRSPAEDFGKAAMSFLVASVVAVSSTNTLLPVETAFAAAQTETVDLNKLPGPERNRIVAKKNLESAKQALKDYQKYAMELKGVENKAESALQTQAKIAANVKKAAIADSDKLSSAKNSKMPQSAIQELALKAGEYSYLLHSLLLRLLQTNKVTSLCVESLSQNKGSSQSGRKERSRAFQGGIQGCW